MAEDADAEKKHAPTERRLRDAREKGQIRRSNDLPKAAVTLLLILVVAALGGAMGGLVKVWMVTLFRRAGQMDFYDSRLLVTEFLVILAGFLSAVTLLAVLAGSASGGWMMTLSLLMPKVERVDPAQVWKQVFSVSNMIEILKSILKVVVIGGAAWIAYQSEHKNFLSLASPRKLTLSALDAPAFMVIAAATAGATVLAGADVAIQMWLNRRTLRMTDQEMRDEMKSAEGDPHLRGRRRAIMRRLARERMRREVRTASVMITNPTHYAVALRYRTGLDAVPVLVAKGVDLNAAPLVEQARASGIPLVEAPPLARGLYRFVDVDQPVPSYLYKAVAEILAYVWKLDAWRSSGGERPVRPDFPESLEKAGERRTE